METLFGIFMSICAYTMLVRRYYEIKYQKEFDENIKNQSLFDADKLQHHKVCVSVDKDC